MNNLDADNSRPWHPLESGDLGVLNTIDSVFSSAQRKNPDCFPNLRGARSLFAASDYGGEHPESRYLTYSFLLTDMKSCPRWFDAWRPLRDRYLPDRRRIAYKSLNDRIRGKALGPFLEIANSLPGILVSFVVRKNVESLFNAGGRIQPEQYEHLPIKGMSPSVAEKFLRVVNFLGLLLAGFSEAGQDVLWVTDEDPIAANPQRVRHLCTGLALASSRCLSHDLRHLRVATANQDPGDLSVEDLLALPDIAAGGLPPALEQLFGERGVPSGSLAFPATREVVEKTKTVLNWFSDNTQRLRRFVVMIEEPVPSKLLVTHLKFHGLRDQLLENGEWPLLIYPP